MATWVIGPCPGPGSSGTGSSGPLKIVTTIQGVFHDADGEALGAAIAGEVGAATAGAVGARRDVTGVVVCDLRDVRRPDIETVGAVGRLKLATERVGWSLQLRAHHDLTALIELMGLTETLTRPCRSCPPRPGRSHGSGVGSARPDGRVGALDEEREVRP